MITGILKIIFYGLLAYIIYMLIRFFYALNKRNKSSRFSKRQSGLMVKDEICNTYLPEEDAIKEVYKGKKYYFCSKECRQKFLEHKT